LNDVIRFKSPYSIRVYELLMQFKITKDRKISLSDFRSFLKLEAKYSTFRDLNKWVIKPALKEINEHSNLVASCMFIKKGRLITTLQFDFEEKNNQFLGAA